MNDIEQRSQEWFAMRAGKVTASRIADVVAKNKSGWGTSRANYAAQLIAERLTGTVAESYTSAAMQYGTETEPLARKAYELSTSAFVEQVGFFIHPTIDMSGASPDGLVDDDGLIEIKCPNTATHIETLLGAEIDKKYMLQMQWQMACTRRLWCDFVSFDLRLPVPMQLHVRRVVRDDKLISSLEIEVKQFLAEIALKTTKLSELYPQLKEAA